MPLTTSPAWLATLDTSPSFLVQCVRIQRADGEVFGITNHVRDLSINDTAFVSRISTQYADGAHTYRSDAGMTPSELQETAGLEPDNYNLQIFLDDTITQLDVLQRRFAGAEVATFTYDYADPSKGIFELRIGFIGEAEVSGQTARFEVKALSQKAAQRIGDVTSETCRAQFGDELCGVDLDGDNPDGFDYRGTTTVSEVLDSRRFKTVGTEALTFPTDFFERGHARFTDGLNSGLSFDIESYDAVDGIVTLRSAPLVPLQVSDGVFLQAGCKKTYRACWEDHDNALNHRAEPWHPTPETVNKIER